jgi:DNA-binding MarR family transcriptional regulator
MIDRGAFLEELGGATDAELLHLHRVLHRLRRVAPKPAHVRRWHERADAAVLAFLGRSPPADMSGWVAASIADVASATGLGVARAHLTLKRLVQRGAIERRVERFRRGAYRVVALTTASTAPPPPDEILLTAIRQRADAAGVARLDLADAAELIGAQPSTAWRWLQRLERAGRIERQPPKRSHFRVIDALGSAP